MWIPIICAYLSVPEPVEPVMMHIAQCTCSPTLLYIYCKCILLLQIRGNRLAFGSVEIILSIIQLLMAGYKQCFTVSNTLTYCIFCGETLLDKMAALHDRSEWQEWIVGLHDWSEWLDCMTGLNGWTEWLDCMTGLKMAGLNGWIAWLVLNARTE